MTTFKAGDVVVCIDPGGGGFLVKGREYVVAEIIVKDGKYCVKIEGSSGKYFPSRFSRVTSTVMRQGAAEYEDAIKAIEIFDKIK